MNFTKSESAVSPVIGTILLVAIAVVLVAIILAVVMGFSGDTNEKKVGLNAKAESGANATLILYGGASIDELVKLEMIDQGSANGSYVKLWEKDSDMVFVGLPYLAEGVAQPEQSMAVYDTRINVRGTFSDGSEVILLVQPMTFYDVVKEVFIHPNIEAPLVISQTMVPDEGVTADVTVSHTGLDATLTGGKIYYESTDGTIKGSMDATLTGDSDSGGLAGSLPGLWPNVTYTVWSVFESTSGSITGPSGTFISRQTWIGEPSVWADGNNNVLITCIININGRDSTTPRVSVIYQVADDPATQRTIYTSTPVSYDGGTAMWAKTSSYFQTGVEYYVWGVYHGYFGDVISPGYKFEVINGRIVKV